MKILIYGKGKFGPYRLRKLGPIAESYNEVTAKQLKALCKMFSRNMPDDRAEEFALKTLLNKSFVSYFMMPADLRERMFEHSNWVFEKNTLTEQLIPKYRGFVGPKREFDNLSMGEFHAAEKAYYQYTQEENSDALNELVAILYRKAVKKYNYKLDSAGDARVPFNENEVSFYAKKIKRWPLAVKLAICHFYDGCRQYLLENYNEVYSGNKGENDPDGMYGVISSLAGNVFGTIEKVELLNVHTAHMEMRKQIRQAKEVEKLT